MNAKDLKTLKDIAEDDGAHGPGFPGTKTAMATMARVLLEIANERESEDREVSRVFGNRNLDIVGGAK